MADLKLENVSLRYGKQQALKDVSFTLKENTICGLLGRNGAGKTSLMNLIASCRPATSGSLYYDGKLIYDNPDIMPEIALIRNRNEEVNSSKVNEYLHIWSTFRPRWDETYAQRLLEQFEIPMKKSMMELSLGQKATVRAVLGLASRCPVTLYDEAYLGMDAAVRKKFIDEIMEDYMNNPRTILFSTHFIGEVENMLEEVLVLNDGCVYIHDECDTLRNKGVTVFGDSLAVDEFIKASGFTLLTVRTLGTQKEVTLFGNLSEELNAKAMQLGVEMTRPSLQDLFVYMTEKDVSIDQSDGLEV